jgi:uncharacterized damage-inducible protein DinB
VDILSAIDYVEIDKRHERNGRTITIRSYVIDIMVEHERHHAVEIEQWRQDLERAIDPVAIKALLLQNRAGFMDRLDQIDADDVLDKTAVGVWSISDLVGHIADWELQMLKAGYHIHDPSRPVVPRLGDSITDINDIMVANRAEKSWPENYHDLRETQGAIDDFVTKLRANDWRRRGPYPWPDDQGTLAELLVHVADHYSDHLPDLERWYEKKH